MKMTRSMLLNHEDELIPLLSRSFRGISRRLRGAVEVSLKAVFFEVIASGRSHNLRRARTVIRVRAPGAIPVPIAKSSSRLELRPSVGLRLAVRSPYTAQSFLMLS